MVGRHLVEHAEYVPPASLVALPRTPVGSRRTGVATRHVMTTRRPVPTLRPTRPISTAPTTAMANAPRMPETKSGVADSSTPATATPTAEPSWRDVFSTPAAVATRSGGASASAATVAGATASGTPQPTIASAHQ